MKEVKIKIRWENSNKFSFNFNPVDGSEYIEVVSAEENGHIAVVWPHLQKACETFFKQLLVDIGEEMKA